MRPELRQHLRYAGKLFLIALVCFLLVLLLDGPGIFAGVLLAATTICIGAGTLAVMHVIRDM